MVCSRRIAERAPNLNQIRLDSRAGSNHPASERNFNLECDVMTIYLLQSEINGYVHEVFSELRLAQAYTLKNIKPEERHKWVIIERKLIDSREQL